MRFSFAKRDFHSGPPGQAALLFFAMSEVPRKKAKSSDGDVNAAKHVIAAPDAVGAENHKALAHEDVPDKKVKYRTVAAAEYRARVAHDIVSNAETQLRLATFRLAFVVPIQERLVRGGAPIDLAEKLAEEMVKRHEYLGTDSFFRTTGDFHPRPGSSHPRVADGCDMNALLVSCGFKEVSWKRNVGAGEGVHKRPDTWECSFIYQL